MSNYEHEIICPDNKGIRNYLWYDYFHDSKINNIFFDHTKGFALLTLECRNDINEAERNIKGGYDTDLNCVEKNLDNHTYLLTFKGTKYFHTERLIMVNDYLRGRFKDTALLKKLSSESKKSLYHFRIQLDDGYIDIIFSDFTIRKKSGRLKYPNKNVICQTCETLNKNEKMVALDGGDYERFLAMQKLFKANDSDLLEIARHNFQFDSEYGESYLYSAYLLGKLGGISDIPKLLDLFLSIDEIFASNSICRCGALIVKRNILDAIELIHYRVQNEGVGGV